MAHPYPDGGVLFLLYHTNHMKLSQEQLAQYQVLNKEQNLAIIQDIVSLKDFCQLMQPEGKTLVAQSPHLWVASRICGFDAPNYEGFAKEEFVKIITKNEFGDLYDTVLIDVDDNVSFQKKTTTCAFRWFIHCMGMFLKDGGKLKGRFPLHILLQFQDAVESKKETVFKWFQIDTVYVKGDHCILHATKQKKHKLTQVVYSCGKSIEVDANSEVILKTYNEEFYSYLKNVNDKNTFDFVSLTGKDFTIKEQLDKKVSWNKNIICVYTSATNKNIKKKLSFDKYEKIANNRNGCDCFQVPDSVNYESYISALSHPKVRQLLLEMCYNKYQSLKMNSKRKIFNSDLISFANK
jgi:hypothetical protein